MKTQDYANSAPTPSSRLFGTDATGQTKNFTVQSVLALNSIPSVVTTNALTSATISSINTYFTGTTGASFAITFPASNSSLDGIKFVVMSTAARANTTWTSTGATFAGVPPAALVADTPVCFQYNHSDLKWYRSL